MRPVLVLSLAALVLAASAPSGLATNECWSGTHCVTFSTSAVADEVAVVPDNTYYLYGAAALCSPPASGDCAGKPFAKAVGLLYQETNGGVGLQRHPTLTFPTPDTVLLL